ncbi:MAG: adenylate/guanylate cyclase domain-containing protein [bacterium]|nr:adenylate/guanylate cyclase domain-containing protein [bacterium]
MNKKILNTIKTVLFWLMLCALFGLVYFLTYSLAEPKIYDFMTKNVLVQKLSVDKYKKVYGSDDVVLLVIDAKSVEKYRWPWKRELYSTILNYFEQYSNPKLIVHDFILTSPDIDNPLSDAKYYDTVKKTDKLITGFMPALQNWDNKNYGKSYDEIFEKKFSVKNVSESNVFYDIFQSLVPFPKDYLMSANNVGHVIAFPGGFSKITHINNIQFFDEVLRNQLPFIRYKGAYYPSIGIKAFLMLNSVNKIVIDKNYITFEGTDLKLKHNLIESLPLVPVRFYKLRDGYYSHKMYSAIDIIESYENLRRNKPPIINPSEFNDKIVVIGANVPAGAGLNDNKNTSIRSEHPGVDFQATVIDNIIHNDFLSVMPQWLNLLITILGILIIYFSIRISNLVKSISSVLLLIFGYILFTIACFYYATVINVITPITMFILTTLVAYTHKYVIENKNKEKVKSALGKYMSQDVMKNVVENIDNLGLGGKKAVVTVLFADIRGFTSMSEKMSAQQVSEILNEYFSEMEPIITGYKGIINKFIGDAIMAVFGEPIQDKNHSQNAVMCGYAMLKRVKELHKKWSKEGKPELEIGIGINTGEVFIGNIGSVNRMEYTVIGDTVNLASRLESYNKTYKTKMLISASVFKEVRGFADIIKIPDVQIRGKANKMDIYEVIKVKMDF